MKKSNYIIILILSIILIISGLGICLISSTQEKNLEIRDYNKVVETEKNQINQLKPTEESYIELVKQIGFDDVICEEIQNDLKNRTCKGTKKGYRNSDLMDFTSYSYMNEKIESIAVNLYFYKDDYTTENITNTLNTIINN